MTSTIATTAAALVCGLALGTAGAAVAAGGSDQPGGVTRVEFDHAARGMTKATIHDLYGASAHFIFGWWGDSSDNWYGAFKYREDNGQWTDVTYVDRHGDGVGPLRLVRKTWYPAPVEGACE